MTRGLHRAWIWRRAYWDRVAPRRLGVAAMGLLPLFFFLPLQDVSVFGERTRGTAILIWLFSLSLAFALRGGQELRNEASIWPFQKGFSLGEIALEDWILDLGLLGVAAFWWASVGVLAMEPARPSAPLLWLAFFSLGVTTGGLTHSVTLCLSALGAKRPSDLTILFALSSLLAPVLLVKAPGWTVPVLNLMLPPYRAAVEFHGSIRVADAHGAVGALLHVLLFSGVVLAFGLWRISRWRPKA